MDSNENLYIRFFLYNLRPKNIFQQLAHFPSIWQRLDTLDIQKLSVWI